MNRTCLKLTRATFTVLCALGFLRPVSGFAQVPGTSPACEHAKIHVGEGNRLLGQKAYPLALQEFRAALDACPQNQPAAAGLTRAFLAERQFKSAEQSAHALLALDPRSEDGQYLLAYSYFMQERFPETGKTLQKLLAQNNENPDAHKLMGLTLFFYKEYALAEKELVTALHDRPSDQEALYCLGRVYYSQNSFQPAVEAFQRLIEEDPNSYKGYDNLGLSYAALGKTEEAERAFKKAQELVRRADPTYDWPYANMAEMLLKSDRTEEALPYAEQAAKMNPRSARDQFLWGKALSRGSNLQPAIGHLTKSAALDPSYPEPHYLLGQLYRKLGRTGQADQEFELFRQIREKTQGKKY